MINRATTRLATPADATAVAELLHDFNTEFDVESPGAEVLANRLTELLGHDHTEAIMVDLPERACAGVGLVTLRTNVWYSGPVALLDELYVIPECRSLGAGSAVLDQLDQLASARNVGLIEINVDEGDADARRFYERHGYAAADPDSGERSLYYWREL